MRGPPRAVPSRSQQVDWRSDSEPARCSPLTPSSRPSSARPRWARSGLRTWSWIALACALRRPRRRCGAAGAVATRASRSVHLYDRTLHDELPLAVTSDSPESGLRQSASPTQQARDENRLASSRDVGALGGPVRRAGAPDARLGRAAREARLRSWLTDPLLPTRSECRRGAGRCASSAGARPRLETAQARRDQALLKRIAQAVRAERLRRTALAARCAKRPPCGPPSAKSGCATLR